MGVWQPPLVPFGEQKAIKLDARAQEAVVISHTREVTAYKLWEINEENVVVSNEVQI